MQSERPEYPETKSARRKAWICGVLAIVGPAVFYARGLPDAAPYAFAICAILAAVFGLSIETDRLHRRIDALRDGD